MKKTSVYLSDEDRERLARLAEREGKSQAWVLREALALVRRLPPGQELQMFKIRRDEARNARLLATSRSSTGNPGRLDTEGLKRALVPKQAANRADSLRLIVDTGPIVALGDPRDPRAACDARQRAFRGTRDADSFAVHAPLRSTIIFRPCEASAAIDVRSRPRCRAFRSALFRNRQTARNRHS